MLTDHCQSTSSTSNDHATDDDRSVSRIKEAKRRQLLTVVFAIVLASMASIVGAQEIVPTLQYDGSTAVGPATFAGGGATAGDAASDARPAYVELSASLANFDADADPDGWRADIVLRDRRDRPTVMRARASFELMPRIAMVSENRYINGSEAPIRWSMPLEFDELGIARVKLPLRESLRPMLGWSTAIHPQSGSRSHNSGVRRSGVRIYSRTRPFVTVNLQDTIGVPNHGELRVRVSVPTQGVFESAVPVRIRPSVLVDTHWPSR